MLAYILVSSKALWLTDIKKTRFTTRPFTITMAYLYVWIIFVLHLYIYTCVSQTIFKPRVTSCLDLRIFMFWFCRISLYADELALTMLPLPHLTDMGVHSHRCAKQGCKLNQSVNWHISKDPASRTNPIFPVKDLIDERS